VITGFILFDVHSRQNIRDIWFFFHHLKLISPEIERYLRSY
jgi:hypothetical protein